MLHTGRTLFHIQGEGQEIPETHATLGACLKNAGYATFATGKWHNDRSSFARSFTCGDEIFLCGMGDHWNVPVYRFDPAGKYDRKRPYVADPVYTNALAFRDCDHIEAGQHSTELFLEAALRFLAGRDRSRPFFMYVSLMAPHDPRTMPERFRKMYDPERIDLPPNFLPEHPLDTGALRIRDELLAAFPRDPREIRRHIAEYYAMISHLDDAFGRLLSALEQSGELANTIIVFAGDNGLAVGQHGLMGKQSLYDHSVRVPLVFAGPGIPRGQRRKALVYLLDIFPTLCDLTATPIPASVEGQSLFPCFGDPAAEVRQALYLAYANSIRGVSDGSHKLIEYACGATQLFDLSRDPAELHNLAEQESSGADLSRLRQRLVSFADEWDDQRHPTGREFWSNRPDLK